MTVWLFVAMFITGQRHYEVYAKQESCETRLASISKNEDTIAYCTKMVLVP